MLRDIISKQMTVNAIYWQMFDVKQISSDFNVENEE